MDPMNAVHRVTLETVAADDPRAMYCQDAFIAEINARFPSGYDQANASAPTLNCPYLIAHLDGVTLGGGALKPWDDETGEVKRLWVSPDARGLGLARRLMKALEEDARAQGLTRLILDTNSILVEAVALYRKDGWVEIDRFNDDPNPDLFFEKRL